jgi:diguanylate cyclase (GGDEF)-like protein
VARTRPTRRPARPQRAAAPEPLARLPHGPAARGQWADAVTQALGRGEPCTLALVDVDGFAAHAERLGAPLARAALAEVARRLAARLSDRALIGRLAGDLFGVALPAVDLEPALGLMEQVREALGKAPVTFGRGPERQKLALTVSIGLAAAPRDATDPAALLDQARSALWRAKSLGGNRVGLPFRERMVLKSSHYPQGQLEQLKRLAQRRGVAEAVLLREALDDLFLKHKDRPPG